MPINPRLRTMYRMPPVLAAVWAILSYSNRAYIAPRPTPRPVRAHVMSKMTTTAKAGAGEDKTHSDRGHHKAGQTKVQDRNDIFEKEGVQRQVPDIEQVNGRQSAQQQQLRPLGRI